jgi:hypothetical protein
MVEGSQFDDVPADRLARLMRDDFAAPADWTAGEIEAIYRHQLASPIQVELGALAAGDAHVVASLSSAGGLLLKSIGDFLHHQQPPAPLLVMLKDFAKRLMEHPESPLPREVASLLYWSAIAAGLAHGGRRLTTLQNDKIVEGLRWAASHTWVDAPTVELFRAAEATVVGGSAANE